LPSRVASDAAWNVSLYAVVSGRIGPMGNDTAQDAESDPEIDSLRGVVPGRAVLTELARGFLLVHESNPGRALRFAETFLRECSDRERERDRTEPAPVASNRRMLGRLPRGAVDPSNFPPVR